jgi:hypothetical protein
MEKYGPFVTKKDMELAHDLEVYGPATIKHQVVAAGAAVFNGPVSIKSGSASAGRIDVSGPLSVKNGAVVSRSVVDITGPLAVKEATVECEALNVNGTVTVGSGSTLHAAEVHVFGPMKSDIPLRLEKLKVSGALTCEGDLGAESVEVSAGPVRVKGAVVATSEVVISVGAAEGETHSLIECDRIEAPSVRIAALKGVTVVKKAGVQVAVQGEGGGVPYVEVDVKGERISLEDVRHKGRIEGELVLMGDATHED